MGEAVQRTPVALSSHKAGLEKRGKKCLRHRKYIWKKPNTAHYYPENTIQITANTPVREELSQSAARNKVRPGQFYSWHFGNRIAKAHPTSRYGLSYINS